MRFIWLAVTSISRPRVSGWSVSRLKYLTSCCLPSSKTVKASFSRLPIKPLFLSRTLKRMFTTSMSTLMEGGEGSWANSRAEARVRGSNLIRLILVDARFVNLVPKQRTPMRKAILHLKKADPVLRSLIDRVGAYRIEYRYPGFETLVRSIVYQQLSGKVAKVIFGRLVEAAGGQLTPEAFLNLRPARVRRAGLSKQKTAYIRDLSRKTKRGVLNFTALPGLSDDEVIAMLTQVKGIGVWTAHMFLMFALERPNVLPTGDLGIRMAIRKEDRMEELPNAKQIEERAAAWHPYCTVASWR